MMNVVDEMERKVWVDREYSFLPQPVKLVCSWFLALSLRATAVVTASSSSDFTQIQFCSESWLYK